MQAGNCLNGDPDSVPRVGGKAISCPRLSQPWDVLELSVQGYIYPIIGVIIFTLHCQLLLGPNIWNSALVSQGLQKI